MATLLQFNICQVAAKLGIKSSQLTCTTSGYNGRKQTFIAGSQQPLKMVVALLDSNLCTVKQALHRLEAYEKSDKSFTGFLEQVHGELDNVGIKGDVESGLAMLEGFK